MKKVFLTLLSACCLNVSAFAAEDASEAAYCYGVYEAIKSPEEIEKVKVIFSDLTKKQNSPYDAYQAMTSNAAFKKGKGEALTLSPKRQHQCLMNTYVFLAVLQSSLNQKANDLQLNSLYCLGYIEAVGKVGFIRDLCSDKCSKTSSKKDQTCTDKCYKKLKDEAIANSSDFESGSKAGAVANPMQVTQCRMSIANAMNTEQKMKKTLLTIWPKMDEM